MQAETESTIKGFVDDPELRAMIFDLDSIGDGAKDGIEVLQEIRALREDIVLVAISSSNPAHHSGDGQPRRAPTNFFFLRRIPRSSLLCWRAPWKNARWSWKGRRLVEQVESRSAFCGMIGGSNAMQKLYQTIQAVADSNTTVVLRGESGTGKELIAQAIVQIGDARGQAFHMPELLRSAGHADGVGIIWLREGRVHGRGLPPNPG